MAGDTKITKPIYIGFPGIFLCFLALSLCAGQRADFLIVQHPRSLTILDQFQQQISKVDGKLFLPNSPFQILKEQETLGDELTHAHRVNYQGITYFVLLDDEGRLPGQEKGNEYEIFRNCILFGDSIRIKQDNTFHLAENFPLQGKQQSLQKDDILVRQFSYKGYYYILRTGKNKKYGWSSLKPRSAWEQIKRITVKQETVLRPAVRDRIIAQFKSVNATYQQYFNFFNRQTGQQKKIPQWEFRSTADHFSAALQGNKREAERLKTSTAVLMQDLKNILLGKPFSVSYKQGAISIQPKNN